ncbi:MAG: beta-ketoacyl reductase, partial [Cypionkella sp.]
DKAASLTILGRQPEAALSALAAEALAGLRQGGRVAYLACDLGASTAAAALQDLRCDGIFHLAGVAAAGSVDHLSPDGVAASAGAKIVGTDTLLALAPQFGAAWMVAFASVIGTFGGAGFASYAMANRYQQARASQHSQSPCPLITLNWSMWEGIGMSAAFADTGFVAQKGYDLLSGPRAMQALEWALQTGEPTLQIGLDPTRLALSAHLCLPSVALLDHSPVVAHLTPLTQQLCKVWAQVLGRAAPAPAEANIFDLGATSLDLPRAQETMSQLLGRDIDVLDFFDHPTINGFSAHLSTHSPEQTHPSPPSAPAAAGNSELPPENRTVTEATI